MAPVNDSSTLGMFYRYFSVFNGSAILPSDKIKLRLLASGHYLKILILWLLIPTFFNNDPVHKNEFDVPMMEYNYASQVFMNATEDFIASTSKHYTSFHSVPETCEIFQFPNSRTFLSTKLIFYSQ